MIVKVSTGKTATKHQFDDDCSFLALKSALASVTGLADYEIEVLVGFPPTVIQPLNPMELARNLGVTSGVTVTVRSCPDKREMYKRLLDMGFPKPVIIDALNMMRSNSIAEAVALCQSSTLAQDSIVSSKMVRKEVAADNSCLFNAIDFLIADSSMGPMYYRRIVADVIQLDPLTYNSDFLDKDPSEYTRWILNPDKWGGEIEVSILSKQLQVEIAVIDIQTNISLVYGEDLGYKQRIALIYDGTHYDPLVQVISLASGRAIEKKQFPAGSHDIVEESKVLARELQKKRQFVNLQSGTIICKNCGEVFAGQREAVEHAKVTSHVNFDSV
jgi:ubiquitin thioesterase OTU1